MFGLIRAACLVSVSIGAGLFTQEMVTSFSAAEEETEVAIAADRPAWSTAEEFYRSGRFGYYAAVSAERCPSAVAALSLAAGEEISRPPMETLPEESSAAAELSGQGDFSSASDQPLEAVVESAASVADATGITETEPDGAPGDAAKVPAHEAVLGSADTPSNRPVPELDLFAQSNPRESVTELLPFPEMQPVEGVRPEDVLPAPAPAETVPRNPGFGLFPDDVERPSRDLPSPAADPTRTPPTYDDIASAHSMRYVDPMALVRRRAVEKAEQRQKRIEARKWLGYMPLRPPVSAVPYTSGETARPAFVVIPYLLRDTR
jgi:hypothetical protein